MVAKAGVDMVARAGQAEAGDATAENLQAMIEARLKSLQDTVTPTPAPETAGPSLWWDMYAIGPFKSPLQPFPAPNQIVRLGETVYVASILVLSQSYPSPSAADVLATFALPYRISWDGSNVTTWQKVISGSIDRNLVPGQSVYVDIIAMTPTTEGLHEVNVRGRITGCNGELAPPFAGYASLVSEFDSSLFTFGAHTRFQGPVRFDVYR